MKLVVLVVVAVGLAALCEASPAPVEHSPGGSLLVRRAKRAISALQMLAEKYR